MIQKNWWNWHHLPRTKFLIKYWRYTHVSVTCRSTKGQTQDLSLLYSMQALLYTAHSCLVLLAIVFTLPLVFTLYWPGAAETGGKQTKPTCGRMRFSQLDRSGVESRLLASRAHLAGFYLPGPCEYCSWIYLTIRSSKNYILIDGMDLMLLLPKCRDRYC